MFKIKINKLNFEKIMEKKIKQSVYKVNREIGIKLQTDIKTTIQDTGAGGKERSLPGEPIMNQSGETRKGIKIIQGALNMIIKSTAKNEKGEDYPMEHDRGIGRPQRPFFFNKFIANKKNNINLIKKKFYYYLNQL